MEFVNVIQQAARDMNGILRFANLRESPQETTRHLSNINVDRDFLYEFLLNQIFKIGISLFRESRSLTVTLPLKHFGQAE